MKIHIIIYLYSGDVLFHSSLGFCFLSIKIACVESPFLGGFYFSSGEFRVRKVSFDGGSGLRPNDGLFVKL